MKEKMRIYKIYSLCCPDTNVVRYVGYTYKKLHRRLSEHCNPSKLTPNTHKNNWIKSLLNCGKRPVIKLVEDNIGNLTLALDKEIFFISIYKSNGFNLTNSTDGGEGHLNRVPSKQTIDKRLMTKIKNGTLKHSKETIEKIRQSKIGIKNPESIKRLSDINRRQIVQLDFEGNILNEWRGVRFASRKLGISHCGICRNLKGSCKSYKDFVWKYKDRLPQ